mmetsp:Transcript_8390/g.23937  ORF Transcript_8390/g.23937 Transcript_8390/m.23937 type:complete len:247 (+) Transcript_8390:703-1443(+)
MCECRILGSPMVFARSPGCCPKSAGLENSSPRPRRPSVLATPPNRPAPHLRLPGGKAGRLLVASAPWPKGLLRRRAVGGSTIGGALATCQTASTAPATLAPPGRRCGSLGRYCRSGGKHVLLAQTLARPPKPLSSANPLEAWRRRSLSARTMPRHPPARSTSSRGTACDIRDRGGSAEPPPRWGACPKGRPSAEIGRRRSRRRTACTPRSPRRFLFAGTRGIRRCSAVPAWPQTRANRPHPCSNAG